MELILSHIIPAKHLSKNSQKDVWRDNISKAEQLKIATGYISADSIIELKKIVEVNSKPHVDLLIGMHYFDKFTRPQYDAVLSLNSTLTSKGLGAVYLSNVARFHGKMYSFSNDEKCFSAIIGSSNLGSIIGTSNNLYEVDCLFNESSEVSQIDKTISELIFKLGTDINQLPIIESFNTKNTILENHYGVTKITPDDYFKAYDSKTGIVFEIPVKDEPKSNLNAFFGKGRENKRGFVMPRPWYEVELIVPRKITINDNYPKNKTFTVYTDDFWSFKCTTNGAYAKNLRSCEDLKILGKWIKGRLEQEGFLKIGEPVTAAILSKYGNDMIRLTGTADPNVWLLDFKR